MADPRMMALVDYLRANYRRPGETFQTPPQRVPRMPSDAYRTGQFIRSAPAHLPPPEQARALVALLTGGRSGLATRMSFDPVED